MIEQENEYQSKFMEFMKLFEEFDAMIIKEISLAFFDFAAAKNLQSDNMKVKTCELLRFD